MRQWKRGTGDRLAPEGRLDGVERGRITWDWRQQPIGRQEKRIKKWQRDDLKGWERLENEVEETWRDSVLAWGELARWWDDRRGDQKSGNREEGIMNQGQTPREISRRKRENERETRDKPGESNSRWMRWVTEYLEKIESTVLASDYAKRDRVRLERSESEGSRGRNQRKATEWGRGRPKEDRERGAER